MDGEGRGDLIFWIWIWVWVVLDRSEVENNEKVGRDDVIVGDRKGVVKGRWGINRRRWSSIGLLCLELSSQTSSNTTIAGMKGWWLGQQQDTNGSS